MSINTFALIYYVMFWGSRIRGGIRRWKQPVLRGPEWFFGVHVQSGFYSGAGKKLLDRYRIRMLAVLAADLPVAAFILIYSEAKYLLWLALVHAIVIHINHLFSVDSAQRKARAFVVPEDEQPVSGLALSLQPRRLREYTNPTVERIIIFVSLGVVIWLLRFHLHSPQTSVGSVFAVPAFLLYCQAGLLLVKIGIVGWRMPIPQFQAQEHLEAREAARRLHLKVCDWMRVTYTGMLLVWPFVVSSSPQMRNVVLTSFLLFALVSGIGLAVWHEMGRDRVVKANLRARPMRLPEFLESGDSGWPVCFQPAAPTLLIHGARGYSLNLANRLALLGAAYVAGFIALLAVLRMIH